MEREIEKALRNLTRLSDFIFDLPIPIPAKHILLCAVEEAKIPYVSMEKFLAPKENEEPKIQSNIVRYTKSDLENGIFLKILSSTKEWVSVFRLSYLETGAVFCFQDKSGKMIDGVIYQAISIGSGRGTNMDFVDSIMAIEYDPSKEK